MSGSYYCYDNPAALINQLQSRFRGTVVAANFDYDFQLLYSVYSLPNIALPLLGGVLVDRAGVRFSLLLFSTLITSARRSSPPAARRRRWSSCSSAARSSASAASRSRWRSRRS